jgi:hypothetical protein
MLLGDCVRGKVEVSDWQSEWSALISVLLPQAVRAHTYLRAMAWFSAVSTYGALVRPPTPGLVERNDDGCTRAFLASALPNALRHT